jgi:hypothetical protein
MSSTGDQVLHNQADCMPIHDSHRSCVGNRSLEDKPVQTDVCQSDVGKRIGEIKVLNSSRAASTLALYLSRAFLVKGSQYISSYPLRTASIPGYLSTGFLYEVLSLSTKLGSALLHTRLPLSNQLRYVSHHPGIIPLLQGRTVLYMGRPVLKRSTCEVPCFRDPMLSVTLSHMASMPPQARECLSQGSSTCEAVYFKLST